MTLSVPQQVDAPHAFGELHRRRGRPQGKARQQFRKRRQTFADQRHIGPGQKIRGRGIAHIRARCDHPRSGPPRRADHLAGRAAHEPQAHLAQEIERILVQQHDLRLDQGELAVEFANVICEHGVEKRHLVSRFPEHRGHMQRGQRRIRFPAFQLLVVQTQEIRVTNQNGQHCCSVRLGACAPRYSDRGPLRPRAAAAPLPE